MRNDPEESGFQNKGSWLARRRQQSQQSLANIRRGNAKVIQRINRNHRLEKMLIKLPARIWALEQTQWRKDAAKFRRLSESSNQAEDNRQPNT
jgi:hypothetical protein